MLIYLIFSMFMFLVGAMSFCLKRKHFLMMLLSLEFIILSLYFNLYIYLSLIGYDYYFSMIFLSLSVCEGALGLSILVSMIRSHGNDYFQSFSVLW